nr:ribonuclease H-like domain-containing protein [Tanacetum cinerariifolium]
NGNSFKPVPQTTANADGTSTLTIPGPVTTEEKAQKKNDVKARSILLMALPNEHLLTFNQYKDAKTLFEAIQARFGGNDATKKIQRTLLKQMYENFNAPSTESLDSIFNRLQKIVSRLAILGKNISQEDLNMKFLKSFPSEWNTYVVVQRNKADLDTMSIDDLYNNFKIVKQEVKRIVASNSISGSQNMAFLSSPCSTIKVDTARHFARECRSPRNQESGARNQDSLRKPVNVEDTSSKAMVLIEATWLMMKFQPTWLLWLSQTQCKSVCVDTSNEIKKVHDALIIEDWVSHSDEDESEEMVLKFDNVQHKPEQANQPRKGTPQDALKDLGYFDSGCSRHMTGYISYLTDFKENDEGYVAFGGGAKGGKITGKGTIRTGELDFKDVYFVKEL